jgi:hypothetical protein
MNVRLKLKFPAPNIEVILLCEFETMQVLPVTSDKHHQIHEPLLLCKSAENNKFPFRVNEQGIRTNTPLNSNPLFTP